MDSFKHPQLLCTDEATVRHPLLLLRVVVVVLLLLAMVLVVVHGADRRPWPRRPQLVLYANGTAAWNANSSSSSSATCPAAHAATAAAAAATGACVNSNQHPAGPIPGG